MERMVQSRFFMIAGLGLILLLSGCPKKVSPVGPVTKPPESQKLGGLPPEKNPPKASLGDGQGNPLGTSPNDEEIPSESTDEVASTAVPPVVAPLPAADLADIFFDFGQWTVRPTDRTTLQKNTLWLQSNPQRKISIEGHADKRGTTEYNLVLAEKRAATVQEYLVQLGIPASRMLVISYGEERPFCSAEDESCFQENRRAHFNAE